MGGIGKALGSVMKVVEPIINIAKMIPGIGQIAGAVDAGLNIVTHLADAFKKGFPKGLVDVAQTAIKHFLPGPLGNVASAVTGGSGGSNPIAKGLGSLIST
ncbi:MAG TPA: hypothetical protein V6D47_21055 [Oscillatoriaceae cyanobacterium]